MLLERDHVLEELDALARAAGEGRGKVAFVVGEAGIGKTSVLRAFADRLNGRLRSYWTACEDINSPEALTILRELPEVSAAALDTGADGGSRLTLFREALSGLSDVPTVVFIEDLHWADDGSIDFIRYAGRRIEDLPLLLVISSRNEEQGARSRIVRAAGDLPPSSRSRWDLDRLSSVAVGQLAAAQGQIGSRIHMVTDGNPLLVSELLANSGIRSNSIDELVVGRAGQLPPEARAFLDFCSIIPRRVSIDQIEAAGASDESVQVCVDSGLLLPDGDGLAFRHELTRHAIEDALTPLRRRQLHASELDRLDRAGASPARRLHHAISSGNRERIIELAPIAAEQAARLGAHGEAVRAWGAMLELDDAGGDPMPRERYAFELHMIGKLPEAIEWQKRVIDLYAEADDRLRLGDCLRFLSRLRYMNGERALADSAAEDAIGILEPLGETAELADAYNMRAQLAMLADRNLEAVRWSELAGPIAGKFDRNDLRSTILNNHGTALQYRDYDRALAMLEQSIELGMRSGSHEHVARAYINRGWMVLMRPALAASIPALEQGIEYCRENELAAWEQYMRGGKALANLGLGRWDEALTEASAVLAHPAATALVRNPATRALATLQIRRGLPGVEGLVKDLCEHGAKGAEAPRFNSYAMIVAERAWTAEAEHEAALALLAEAFGLAKPDARPWDAANMWFWSRKLGASFEQPELMPEPFARLASGDIEGAASAMRELDMPFDEAMMLVEGDEEQALRGLALLEQLGAEATAARVRSELAERGIRKGTRGPRASTRSNNFGLTKREIDVLREIDSGKSNKEIANKLFVSPKTVDHHVSSILAKTESRTRGEAAALARREALLH